MTQQAEACIRKRDEAKSVLVRAMLEGETQICREAVETAISKVEAVITRECAAVSRVGKLGGSRRRKPPRKPLETWRSSKNGGRACARCYARLV